MWVVVGCRIGGRVLGWGPWSVEVRGEGEGMCRLTRCRRTLAKVRLGLVAVGRSDYIQRRNVSLSLSVCVMTVARIALTTVFAL